jgi:hypothetical protein
MNAQTMPVPCMIMVSAGRASNLCGTGSGNVMHVTSAESFRQAFLDLDISQQFIDADLATSFFIDLLDDHRTVQ